VNIVFCDDELGSSSRPSLYCEVVTAASETLRGWGLDVTLHSIGPVRCNDPLVLDGTGTVITPPPDNARGRVLSKGAIDAWLSRAAETVFLLDVMFGSGGVLADYGLNLSAYLRRNGVPAEHILLFTQHERDRERVKAMGWPKVDWFCRFAKADFGGDPALAGQRLASVLLGFLQRWRTVPLLGRESASIGTRTDVCRSRTWLAALETVRRLTVDRDCNILICGETGVGKDIVAEYIRGTGGRQNAPWVSLNCAGLPSELAESELYGHMKGGFSGATESMSGAFQHAVGGTLFLDEIGDMPLAIQAKCLRALDPGNRQVRPVRGDETRLSGPVTVVFATNRDLEQEVAAGRFRKDLLQRILLRFVGIPPLRERVEDIASLALHFASAHRKMLSQDALDYLMTRPWLDGNARELRRVVDSACLLNDDQKITAKHFRTQRQSSSPVPTRLVPESAGSWAEVLRKVKEARPSHPPYDSFLPAFRWVLNRIGDHVKPSATNKHCQLVGECIHQAVILITNERSVLTSQDPEATPLKQIAVLLAGAATVAEVNNRDTLLQSLTTTFVPTATDEPGFATAQWPGKGGRWSEAECRKVERIINELFFPEAPKQLQPASDQQNGVLLCPKGQLR
jgi:hypothetical protein